MPLEMLTYAELGNRLNCSPEAARALVKRLRLPRQLGSDGKAVVAVDAAELTHRLMPARSPAGHRHAQRARAGAPRDDGQAGSNGSRQPG